MARYPQQSQQQPADSNLIPQEYRSRHDAFRQLSSRLGLLIALLFLSASVVSYGGVLFYVSGLRTELNDIEASISTITIERDEEEERRILNLDRQLRSANQLIENHRHMSALLNHIEGLTHPLVQFSSFNIQLQSDINQLAVTMDINGPSYGVVAEQLISFQSSPFIAGVDITEFSLSNQGELVGRGVVRFASDILEAEEGFYGTVDAQRDESDSLAEDLLQ